jgi:hypothetical protein
MNTAASNNMSGRGGRRSVIPGSFVRKTFVGESESVRITRQYARREGGNPVGPNDPSIVKLY